jgi:hypothetical protein
MVVIQYLTLVVAMAIVERRFTIFPDMDQKEWLKLTFAKTLKQQTFTSAYLGMIALCVVIASQFELLDLANMCS